MMFVWFFIFYSVCSFAASGGEEFPLTDLSDSSSLRSPLLQADNEAQAAVKVLYGKKKNRAKGKASSDKAYLIAGDDCDVECEQGAYIANQDFSPDDHEVVRRSCWTWKRKCLAIGCATIGVIFLVVGVVVSFVAILGTVTDKNDCVFFDEFNGKNLWLCSP